MPNEESPVDKMEVDEEMNSQNVDQKYADGDQPTPETAEEMDARKAEEMKNLGNSEYTNKDYQKAVQYYTMAITAKPTAAYYGNRAAAYVMLGQYSKAIEDARKSTLLDPSFTKGYLREAKCQLALGEVTAAIHLYEKVLEMESKNSVALTELKQAKHVRSLMARAQECYQNAEYRTVVYNMDRCIEAYPDCPKYKTLKAECLALIKRYDEALNMTNDILRFDGLNAEAMYVRGLCFYYTDAYDKAFQHFQQVLRMAPDHSKAKEAYKKSKALKTKKDEGSRAYSEGKLSEAVQSYEEALTIDPLNVASNSKLHFNLAVVYCKERKYEEAIEQCTKAIRLDKKYTKAYLKRAHCYMELEKYEEAVREYEAVLQVERTSEIRSLYEKAKLELKKSKRKDYYKILNVGKKASTDEIKKAYRKRALLHHPDRHSNATDEIKKAEEIKFKEIGEAYAVLSDPKKKSLYDSGHDLEEINNGGGGHGGFGAGNIDPNIIFQQFFGGAAGGGGAHRGGFRQAGGFNSGGFPGFTFQFG